LKPHCMTQRLWRTKGQGKNWKRMGKAQLSYSTRCTILTIDKLEEIVNAVKSSIDGGLMAISPMDALIHI
jgi:hypothetical protein